MRLKLENLRITFTQVKQVYGYRQASIVSPFVKAEMGVDDPEAVSRMLASEGFDPKEYDLLNHYLVVFEDYGGNEIAVMFSNGEVSVSTRYRAERW